MLDAFLAKVDSIVSKLIHLQATLVKLLMEASLIVKLGMLKTQLWVVGKIEVGNLHPYEGV